MARPSQLGVVFLAYSLGVAIGLTQRTVDFNSFLVGALALLVVASSVHYANEYADHETDRLTTRTPFSGGSGALERSGLSRRLPAQATAVTGLFGLGLATWWTHAGWLVMPAFVVLLSIAVLGWGYSLEPIALAWRGFGELDNALLGGFLAPLYGYAIVVEALSAFPVVVCLPFALVVFVNLLATQWPDRVADAAVGKRTLAVRFSSRRLKRLYSLSCLAAFALLITLRYPLELVPTTVFVATLPVSPFLVWGWYVFTDQESPFPTVTAMVVLLFIQIFGWLVAVGIV
ncbi:prenyltransferase [Halobacteria archaeon AArc-curdl1]|uniref:Prenyltransferase n=1 Tax=Natronosalvus hydrolyticus TaxID=2979988 RepID=A0AAP2Z4I8_9EURY|nr:prenyltransferase [Halobacteria archaeon AArc-curdl1]